MMRRLMVKYVQFMTRSVTTAAGCMRTWGTGGLPEPPYIVASNHQSYFDPVMHGVVLGTIRYMARKTLFRNPLFGGLIRFLGALELDQDQGADLAALRASVDILKGGESLLIFPEGTRTRDGSLGEMKPGVALVAARAGVPVVPAVIDGAHKAWPRGSALPKVSQINIAYGEALEVDRSNVRGFQKELENQIRNLLVQVRKVNL
ncbi:MAG: lysophospholipid acyltransferase family protein [Planctomycetota bacterium]|jgi:1-acyl-sn-glycerol-3-phosphate acyltransferase